MCGKITLCFIKVRIILIVCTNIDVHKKPSHLQKKNSMTRYILTVETHSIYLWIRAIPGQIILVKQISIHVYSIEKVREFDQKIPQSQIVDKPTAP